MIPRPSRAQNRNWRSPNRMKRGGVRALNPYSEAAGRELGQAPGNLNSDGPNLLIYGRHFGNIFVGVQPFGYRRRSMRLL